MSDNFFLDSKTDLPTFPDSPMDLDPENFRKLGHQIVDMATEYLAGVASQPVFTPMTPSERQELLAAALPERGLAPEHILQLFQKQVLPHPMGNGHPRFFGWVNSPPAPIGILAEFLAAMLNPSCAGGDHAAIYLERCATRWLMELVGFPVEGSMGLLVSGGSMASLTCLTAARQWATSADGWNVREEGFQAEVHPRLILYVSPEGHSCIRKAVELLGLGSTSIRSVPVDAQFKMDVVALREAIENDLAAGQRPFCVVASAGTVNTGTVDPLESIADICAEYKLWFHIDGAYGAVGILDSEVAALYAGLERADSLALDPHKWLSVPVECGCALVRHGTILREAFSLVPAYLQTEEGRGFGGLPWFSEYGFQQSRGFKALKLWMTLQQVGRTGFSQQITRHNSLAKQLAQLVEAAPDLELLAKPELSIVCFRYVGPNPTEIEEQQLNGLNKYIMEEVQSSGEAFVSNTILQGKFALRACILHYATTENDLVALLESVRKLGQARLHAVA